MDTVVYIVFGVGCALAGYSMYKVFDLTWNRMNYLEDQIGELHGSYLKFLKDFQNLVEKDLERRQKEQEMAMKLSDLKEKQETTNQELIKKDTKEDND